MTTDKIREPLDMRRALQHIADMAGPGDEDGPFAPKVPYSWETVGRVAINLARAALSSDVEMRAQAGQEAGLRSALERVAALDASKDSVEGLNEWGEADCFHQAQSIALRALAASPAQGAKPLALRDIAAERKRQIEVEGWTPEHDDEHGNGAMAEAAAAYAISSTEKNGSLSRASEQFYETGWAKQWWKPKTPREDLVRAGALIVAEIERLDRLGEQEQKAREGGERD